MSLCILSPVLLICLTGLAESGSFPISAEAADSIGVSVLLLMELHHGGLDAHLDPPDGGRRVLRGGLRCDKSTDKRRDRKRQKALLNHGSPGKSGNTAVLRACWRPIPGINEKEKRSAARQKKFPGVSFLTQRGISFF